MPTLIIWSKDGLFARLDTALGRLLTMTRLPFRIFSFLIAYVLSILFQLIALFGFGDRIRPFRQGILAANLMRSLYTVSYFVTVEQVESGGHHLHMRNAELTAKRVKQFLLD